MFYASGIRICHKDEIDQWGKKGAIKHLGIGWFHSDKFLQTTHGQLLL